MRTRADRALRPGAADRSVANEVARRPGGLTLDGPCLDAGAAVQAMADDGPQARQAAWVQAMAGGRAAPVLHAPPGVRSRPGPVAQRQTGIEPGEPVKVRVVGNPEVEDNLYAATVVAVADGGLAYDVRFSDDWADEAITRKRYAEALVTRAKQSAKPEPRVAATASKPPWAKDHLGLGEALETEVSKLAGEATKIPDLTEDQLEAMIALFEAKAERNLLLTELIKALKFDLKDLQEHNETPEQVDLRATSVRTQKQALEDRAFEGAFGVGLEQADGAQLSEAVTAWWNRVKADEAALGFEAAFKANRMTARQINIGSTARGGGFQAQKLGSRPDPGTDRTMTLDNTVGGVVKRTDPRNFADRATRNREGVHDLSASLLRGDKPIRDQLKKYEESVVLFMPLPLEQDLQVFSALARLKGLPEAVREKMAALLTRPVFVQASDMGTRYVDTRPGSEGEGDFQYGLTGTIIRSAGDRARKVNEADLAERARGALAYRAVATANITKVNEVVMAYRQHESRLFPMFAAWDEGAGIFLELRADLSPTGMSITNDGRYRAP